jgi:NADH-quinone oxidoreductase subunit L
MLQLIWLVPVLPFIGFLLLTLLSGSHVSRRVLAVIGVMSVAISAIVAILLSVNFLVAPPPGNAYVYTYWTWLRVGNFAPKIALHLDALSLVMMLVVTFVGALIHLYSAEFMAEEDHWNYGRLFY